MGRVRLTELLKRLRNETVITVPTWFTIVRIVLVPCIVWAMVGQQWGMAFGLFIAASLTDAVDGTLARLTGQQSFLGACLDPLADKFLLLSVFFTLAFVQSPLFAIPLWFVRTVLAKEIVQIGGAAAIFALRGDLTVQPTLLGKLTTVVQMSFIAWLFACYFFHWLPVKTYYTMLGLMLALVGASFVQYAQMGLVQLKSNRSG